MLRVGSSGSGKSTIAKLITSFWDASMKDAPIIPDEATANVDPENEKELMAQEGVYRRFITGREQAVRWKL